MIPITSRCYRNAIDFLMGRKGMSYLFYGCPLFFYLFFHSSSMLFTCFFRRSVYVFFPCLFLCFLVIVCVFPWCFYVLSLVSPCFLQFFCASPCFFSMFLRLVPRFPFFLCVVFFCFWGFPCVFLCFLYGVPWFFHLLQIFLRHFRRGNCRPPSVAPQLGDRFSTSVCTWCQENRPQLTVMLMGLLKKQILFMVHDGLIMINDDFPGGVLMVHDGLMMV